MRTLALEHHSCVYIFGSALRGRTGISDVDVLVVYRSIGEVKAIKTSLLKVGLRFPLDITCISGAEESELQFIQRYGARRIADLLVKHSGPE